PAISQSIEWNGDGGFCRKGRDGRKSFQRGCIQRAQGRRPGSAPVKQKSRSIQKNLRLIVCGPGPPFVPRSPSLELYVLPIGGGQLLNQCLHIKTHEVSLLFRYSRASLLSH